MNMRSLLVVILLLGRQWSAGAEAAEIIHHDAFVRIDTGGTLHVTDRMTVEGGGPAAFQHARGLTLHGLFQDGQAASVRFQYGRWVLDLGPVGRHAVTVTYSGQFPETDDGQPGERPVIGPNGAFLPAWSGWLPATGGGSASYRLTVDVAAPMVAVATGKLEAESRDQDGYRAVFTDDLPGEPPSLFAGPYAVRERPGDILLRTYLHPGLEGLADDYLGLAARIVDHFRRLIGPYPFEAFHIVSAPLPVGLGFPGLTYIGRRVLPLPFVRNQSLAHEILHNWWGNGIRPKGTSGNWAEGLTTLLADHDLAMQRDPAEARAMRLGWLRDYAALPSDRDAPVASFRGKTHDASQVVGYHKTAFIFHMLRTEIGERAFIGGLRRLWSDLRGKEAGWDDLRAVFEAESGRDLGAFFEQWLRHVGGPTLVIEDASVAGNDIKLKLRQGSPPYRLTVPVEVASGDGTRRHMLVLDAETGAFGLRATAPPRRLAVDPDFDVFRRLATGEAPPIMRDVTLRGDAVAALLPFGDDDAPPRDLAARLMDTEVRVLAAADTPPAAAPLLIIGPSAQVDAYLARHHLPETPAAIARVGTARAWVTRRPDGTPFLVIAADDRAALEAVTGPLPHYGGEGFIVFSGRRVINKGQWPAGHDALSRTFR